MFWIDAVVSLYCKLTTNRFNWIKRYAKSIDREEWQKCHSFSVYIQ